MKLIIARMSGFCMGVRRAVEMVLDAPARHPGPICTFGPLIHNPQVLELLESKGIAAIGEVPAAGKGTVLIRAHGVPPDIRKRLKQAGFHVIDATCPRVIRVQSIIRKHARRNHAVIIVGDRNHPEVIGLRGYAGEKAHVVADCAGLEALPAFDQAIVVAQTTQNTRAFAEIKAWVAANRPHYKLFDTICDSTERRQAEVKRLSEAVDAVIVVGGRESGNTQRLAEIARQCGKPAFHIAAAEELQAVDLTPLKTARAIGITAGASTPNWVIRKVYTTLEAMLIRERPAWIRAAYALMRTALLTNIYVSLGAAGLCAALARLTGLPPRDDFALIAFLYVQSMHILNHLTGSRADRYNDPERARFYTRWKLPLSAWALACGAAGLVAAYAQGPLSFAVLLVMSLLGLSYNLYLVPARFGRLRYRRIRDLPGSKTVLISMAWGVVTALLPALALQAPEPLTHLFIFLWATALVFCRTAFFDILDMQGDRLVGKETIPILLGEKRSLKLLEAVLAALTAGLPLLALFGAVSGFGIPMALCPAAMLLILRRYAAGRFLPGLRLEFLVESHLVLAGVLGLAWTHWH
jgi:4-hydroxy-3-methylbut-2-enyl diphosphate reductase